MTARSGGSSLHLYCIVLYCVVLDYVVGGCMSMGFVCGRVG